MSQRTLLDARQSICSCLWTPGGSLVSLIRPSLSRDPLLPSRTLILTRTLRAMVAQEICLEILFRDALCVVRALCVAWEASLESAML